MPNKHHPITQRLAILAILLAGSVADLVCQAPDAHYLEPSTTLQYLSCNSSYFEYLSTAQLQAAEDYFEFSLMSSNAYRAAETPRYVIPGWEKVGASIYSNGLAYEVYRRLHTSTARDTIAVAFRGSVDWQSWRSNLSLTEPAQYRDAFLFMHGLRIEHPEAHIIATGHSLGGGIALNMSLRVRGVDAVAFNTSPRAFHGRTRFENRRVHIFEVGDFLSFLTRNSVQWRFAHDWRNFRSYKYNFMDFTTGLAAPIHEHSMYLLSRGLLISAITNGSSRAREVFVKNIDRDTAMATEPEVCRHLYH